MKKPLIGISGNTLRDTSGAYVDLIRSYVNQDYVRSIEEAGGIPIIIPFTENLEQAKETIDIVDGLLLTGGHDVYPLNYGEEPLRGMKYSRIRHLSRLPNRKCISWWFFVPRFAI